MTTIHQNSLNTPGSRNVLTFPLQEKELYDKLYLSVYHSVSELTRLAHTSGRQSESGRRKTSALYVEAKCLVAAEVVQLMCLVPAFFDYCTKDTGEDLC